MMKKIPTLFFSVILVTASFAQKSKGFDANSYLRDYTTNNDLKSLQKAKESIDLAAVHDNTKDNVFVLITKGQVYIALYEEEKKVVEKKLKTKKEGNEKALEVLANTPTTNLEISYAAFKKGRELDVKHRYKKELLALKNIKIDFDNTGRAFLNSKKYPEALSAFEQAYEASRQRDTMLLYFCAVSAEYSGDYQTAKDYYEKMVKGRFIKENTYVSLVNMHYRLNDTLGGDEVLKKGREIQPDNPNLLVMEVDYFLRTDNKQEAMSALKKAISTKPGSVNLHVVRGSLYDNMIVDMGDVSKDTIKQKRYLRYVKLAESDYSKAISLDPNHFEALFNLGVLYNNQGVLLNKKADDIFNTPEYRAVVNQAKGMFAKARPMLEKALTIRPKDKSAMIALKQLYTILDMRDELKVMNDRIAE